MKRQNVLPWASLWDKMLYVISYMLIVNNSETEN